MRRLNQRNPNTLGSSPHRLPKPIRRAWCWAAVAIYLSGTMPVLAGESFGFNDFGGTGLLQNPDARMADDGEFAMGVGTDSPYNQMHFRLQLLPWLESVLRYTDVTDVPYGPESFSGNQSYKDRSADFKVRLLEESEHLPALAVGVRDVGGTGIFSSEYLVASRRYYDWDFSMGLGWGRLGADGALPNPLGWFSSHFKQPRVSGTNTSSGNLGVSRLFTGPRIGAFGGIVWRTPIDGLRVVAEYDANNYQHEELGNNQPQSLPINAGLEYEFLPGLDLGVGYERGNQLSLNVNFHTNFEQDLGVAKFADPLPAEIRVRNSTLTAGSTKPLPVIEKDEAACESSRIMDAVRMGFARQGFVLYAASCQASERKMTVWILQDSFRDQAKGIGRAARVMSEAAPDWIEQFTVIEVSSGVEVNRTTLLRADLERYALGVSSPDEIAAHVSYEAPQRSAAMAQAPVQNSLFPQFKWDLAPALRQSVGGPDGFYFYQIFARLSGTVEVDEHLSFASSLGFNIYNDFDKIKLQSNSQLPHVRSDVVKYLQEGPNSLSKLEANYIYSPYSQLYARVSAGIFEEMYAGAATEWLYRPAGARWAAGVDLNRVRQRGYDQRFDFLDYAVTTGHLNVYYEIPYYGLLGRVSWGRYLAKDWGETIDLSRRFKNGVTAGMFATFTNVPAQTYGEGQFDKGVYISLPLDLFFTKSSRRSAGFVFRPLTRDGGQFVRDGADLYGVVSAGSVSNSEQSWPELMR